MLWSAGARSRPAPSAGLGCRLRELSPRICAEAAKPDCPDPAGCKRRRARTIRCSATRSRRPRRLSPSFRARTQSPSVGWAWAATRRDRRWSLKTGKTRFRWGRCLARGTTSRARAGKCISISMLDGSVDVERQGAPGTLATPSQRASEPLALAVRCKEDLGQQTPRQTHSQHTHEL